MYVVGDSRDSLHLDELIAAETLASHLRTWSEGVKEERRND